MHVFGWLEKTGPSRLNLCRYRCNLNTDSQTIIIVKLKLVFNKVQQHYKPDIKEIHTCISYYN